ncbi:MAG: S-layer homology domain-containing protein [Phascolarctobacterium sp.]|nr:S-layer homology domain-containing protein [Phascolarctobacterium sp.]
MKKSLVLAMAMALGVTASAYAANPFSDVPAVHWAYDSISKLAAAGVIEGYGDATFGGDKLMTRYEMAQIVAKAMAKGANVDKLAAEFADELDNLGVRVANLEKKSDNVKITGEMRAHYEDYSDKKNGDNSYLRTRIWFNGQVNEDWTYTAMLENRQHFTKDGNSDNTGNEETRFQRAFVSGRLGGLQVEAGRNNQSIFEGEIYGTRSDAIKIAYGKDVKLTAQYGKLSSGAGTYLGDPTDEGEEYGVVSLAGNVGKLGLEGVYVDVKEDDGLGQDNSIWGLRANYKFDKDWAVRAAYLKGDVDEAGVSDGDDGYYVGVNYKGAKAAKAGSWGLYATYYDMAASTYISNGWASSFANNLQKGGNGGYDGWKVGANVALAKNIVAQIEYMKLDSKFISANDDESLWSQITITF